MDLRKTQLRALQSRKEQEFRLALGQFLREEMPEQLAAVPDEAVLDRIRAAEAEAASYGIEAPVPLAQFVCLWFATPEALSANRNVQAYLRRRDIDQETRMQTLVDEAEKALSGSNRAR